MRFVGKGGEAFGRTLEERSHSGTGGRHNKGRVVFSNIQTHGHLHVTYAKAIVGAQTV